MALPENERSRPGQEAASDISMATKTVVSIPSCEAQRAHLEAIRARSPKTIGAAHAVLVWTPEGKYTRRLYLSLHAADKAMERAAARGLTSSCVMVDLVPVVAVPVIVVGGEDR